MFWRLFCYIWLALLLNQLADPPFCTLNRAALPKRTNSWSLICEAGSTVRLDQFLDVGQIGTWPRADLLAILGDLR